MQTNQPYKEEPMPKLLEIYKCDACGNIVEVVHEGAGELICCGAAMKLMVENTVDAAKEKHVPVIEKTMSGFKVKVGSMAHPMEEKHYIEWVELVVDGKVCRQRLQPGEDPIVKFRISGTPGKAKALVCEAGENPDAEFCTPDSEVVARAYCNIHGLWTATF
jgi:superoxide reductase